MKTYHFEFETNLPIPLAEAWDFFSSPLNLGKITPPEMNLVITSGYTDDSKMYPGLLISYKVSPILGIKMRWVTEITHIKDNEYFIDEQRSGPYAFWQHQHHFKEIRGGVHMTDILAYAIPYGIIGRIANRLFVARKLKKVFAYRQQQIEKMFGVYRER
ncbi:hypothetical protein BEL04_10295 [Mucilaginibacter sp. PPCGB 2223]|uniref:SRPBCC family protein n=1 Tax=Mucilaginibacter sp. PPCGB 2223 TaxID=1886027 RepID=UPI000826196F|nr:SRPBCC family protein [Mucilaginibacter sp. PPCGB 2223]OCX54883.1 hypothetical protein BEL04_10295 [Mucilaginibacter sp. PPCGB 2223]